jgi:hypothetical protein
MKVLAVLAGVVSALAVVTAGTAAVQALITGAQIKDGTIQSRDVKNGAITRLDIADATEAALRGQRGPRGAAGMQGVAGPAGPAGSPGATGAAGPQGPAGAQGVQGPKGDIGEGLHVTGSVVEQADLLDLDASVGDAYIVTADDHLYIWDGEDWVDAGLVRGPAGPEGDVGPAGPQGTQGPMGETGAPGADGEDGGLAGYEIVVGSAVVLSAGQVLSATASCPTGKLAVGGGASVADPSIAGVMVESRPTAGGAGWSASIFNDSEADTTMTPYAVCANAA